ncbi:MAG: hypothetical protein Q7S74_04650 [Nanoarchaeota archaeon]|nr:hypothetical protein [Nanoarchaeota archaeon]
MIGYNDLYELLRKEKYSEPLQQLPKKFIEDFSEYINDKSSAIGNDNNLFADAATKSKKQLENAIAIFKELMSRRKKKILGLVFLATETGIMKRDYENMLSLEKEVFDKLVKAFEEGDKEFSKALNGKKEKENPNKMILFIQNVEQFIDHTGSALGPFKSGEMANISLDVASILVSGGKASFIDED